MSEDICERLLRFNQHKECVSTDLEVEATAEITRLHEENARLLAANKDLQLHFDVVIEDLQEAEEEYYDQINLLKRDEVLQWRMRQEIQAENTRLREVVRELVTALEPFADELKEQEVEVPHVTEDESLIHSYTLRLKHLRAARAAIHEGGTK